MANTCLTYLCVDIFDRRTCSYSNLESVDLLAKPGEIVNRGDILSYRLLEYPFLDYAAEHWGYHVQGNLEWTCFDPIMIFLVSQCPLENAHMVHRQVSNFRTRRHLSSDCADLFPLRVAISFGLEHIACLLVKASLPGSQVEEPEGSQIPYSYCILRVPIAQTTEPEFEQIMQNHWLLSLLEAVGNGLFSVTEALLEAGIDLSPGEKLPLTVRDRNFRYSDERPKTALDKSVFYSYDKIADRLIAKDDGASITKKTVEYAVNAENTKLLGQYLDTATDHAERRRKANVILEFATTNGRLESVKFSLNRGALIECPGAWGDYSALGLAVAHGHSGVVRHLLGAGANTSVELEVYDEDNDERYN